MFAFRPRPTLGPFSALVLGLAFLFTATPRRASAQAGSTARKSMDVSIFAGYDTLTPDYDHPRDTGIGFGANITRYFHFPIEPSLELRGNITQGPTVNESSYLAGFRGQSDFHRFHPYIDALFGMGYIYYNFVANPNNLNYKSDDGFTKSFGAGVDFDVYKNVQLKADYQGQFWHLGKNDTLTPNVLLFGVTYRFPFHPNYKNVTQH